MSDNQGNLESSTKPSHGLTNQTLQPQIPASGTRPNQPNTYQTHPPLWPDASNTFEEPPDFFPKPEIIPDSDEPPNIQLVPFRTSRPRSRQNRQQAPRSTRSKSNENSPRVRRRSLQARRSARRDAPYSAPATPMNSRPNSPVSDDGAMIINEESMTGLMAPKFRPSPKKRHSSALTSEILAAVSQIVAVKKQARAVEQASSADSLPTALAMPEGCLLHSAEGPEINEDPANRLLTCMHELTSSGLVNKCYKVPDRSASLEEITLFHNWHHLTIKGCHSNAGGPLSMTPYGPVRSTNMKKTFDSAALAVGAAIDVATLVAQSKCKNGFAVVRPCGNMATSKEPKGFCVFNSTAIAAKYLLHHQLAKRIMIVDWDLRHGLGCQEGFYEDGNVLVLSLHRYNSGTVYPGTGFYSEIGSSEGHGRNVNIAWQDDEGPLADSDYFAAFRSLVIPCATEFEPDIVLVSAGFTGCHGHPEAMGAYNLSPIGYAHLTQMLMSVTQGKVAMFLEGGFECNATASCVSSCISALLGQDLPPLPFPDNKPNPSTSSTLLQLLNLHKEFWPSLANMVDFVALSPSEFSELDRRHEEEQTSATATLASLRLLSDPEAMNSIDLWQEHNEGLFPISQQIIREEPDKISMKVDN